MKLTSNNIVEEFFKEFPQFLEKVKKESEEWGIDEKTGLHAYFGLIIRPILVDEIENYKFNKITVESIFKFLENMANGSSEVENVLVVTILEGLGDDKKILKISRMFMREKTFELSKIVESYLGKA